MDALKRIKTHLTGETALSHELSESIFEFNDVDVVSLLGALDAVKKVVLIEKLQSHSDMDIRFDETLPLVNTLLEKTMPSGEIKLEGFWG